MLGNGAHMSFGRIAYLTWYRPKAFGTKCVEEGLLNIYLSHRGRRSMELAAERLPEVLADSAGASAIHFLTGSAFWYQTAFCAYSLFINAERPLRVIFVDDGTLAPRHVATLSRIFIGAQFVTANDIDQRLEAYLPAERFPVLRRRRVVYPHLRKLIDIHIGTAGWKLVLDSDMLFHRRPDFLFEWLSAPSKPLHMSDVEDAYGYSAELMQRLAGSPIPRKVNVGLCGLNSSDLDWERLEWWCKTMLEREGSHYLQEQALIAMAMAGRTRSVAPADAYVVQPSRYETEHPTAALHHYVADSKAWYFRFGWQRFFGMET